MRKRRLLRAAAAAGIAALVAGCALGPDYRPPAPQLDPSFEGQNLVQPTAGQPDQQWWKVFGDPLLDELVNEAQVSNRSIAAAEARLREARANRRDQGWSFWPSPTVQASVTSNRQSLGGTPGGMPIERSYDLYDAGFDASWEIDLFGYKRGNQALKATRDVAIASRDNVRLSVVAEVARNYFELRGAQQQLLVAERNAENQRRALEQVQARLDAGRGTALDTARAEAQIETTLAMVPPLEAAVARARHRIEVLVGRQPGKLAERLGAVVPLPELPAAIAFDDPAALMRRRPDLRVAERQLAATSALIGVATAELFPRITLNGAIGLQSLSLDGLGDSGNDYRRFGPSISWAFLDIGRVRERIKAAGARHEAAFANYEQAVLTALEDVENALSDYARERRRQAHLAAAARASVEAADLAAQRFDGGLSDFLQSLDANRNALEAQDALARSRTAAATALVALYKALGAGAEAPPL